MTTNLSDFLSYLIKADGQWVAFMPDEEEFSSHHIGDVVHGIPDLVCFTKDGYALFRNRDGEALQLPGNADATALWHEAWGERPGTIFGRAFLAHPRHIPRAWKKQYDYYARLKNLRLLASDLQLSA